MKKVLILAVCTLVLAALLVFVGYNKFINVKDESSKINEISTSTDDSGAVTEIASYDENLNPLSTENKLKIEGDQRKTIYFEIFNGINYDRDFKIIVLQNFIQTNFHVDDSETSISSHDINIGENKKERIKVSVDVDSKTADLTVLFIKEPNEIVKRMDFDKLTYYEPVYAKRFTTDNDDEKVDVNIKNPDFSYKSEVDDTPIFLSKSSKDRKILPSAQEKTKAYLHIGNPNPTENMRAAIIALKDWDQVKLNGDMVWLVESKNTGTLGYKVDLPEIENIEENLQFILFPYPYEDWGKYTMNPIEYTFRTALLK
ncbi:TPA: hypothetical protein ROY30_004954 [Bacillus cereus]|uniref:Uncharacterized protein n=1 Tax=Bacillus cereus TaxID=1396 RepID=A0A1D3N1D7_BACCE|nr:MULTISPECIES: hypothetical protein [Bacillus]MCP1177922.1 hypothetical protein [Bacillus sp. 1663tsa1]MCP1283088.1 hypothetical protein [Bacillus sp. S0635]MCQ6347738.1 hypothetical protein [Bacillus cereus]MCU5459957.1 hypothetical protein [Bacillus cereus]MCU5748174.1 hypothetical protein [Bacillus cereus]